MKRRPRVAACVAGLVNPVTSRRWRVVMRAVRGYVRQLHWDLGDLVDRGGQADPEEEEEREMRGGSNRGTVGQRTRGMT